MKIFAFSPDNAARQRAGGAGQDGYSLVELLVALTIIVLITSVAVPQVMRYQDRAKSDATRVEINNIGATLDMYRLDVGRYPSTEDGLSGLVDGPAEAAGWNGPYLKRKDMLLDAWGRPYQYRSPGQHGEYDLFSLGADNTEGGEGANRDVASW